MAPASFRNLVSLYKNAVRQGPGILPDMMTWMKNEARRQSVPAEDYFGGFILEDVKYMKMLNTGKMSENLLNHVNNTF